VRGLIALTFLERIEKILQERSGTKAAKISDHFNLIGWSSTGAVIASGLALGHSIAEMIELYLHLSRQGFPHHLTSPPCRYNFYIIRNIGILHERKKGRGRIGGVGA
jgi:patatin-like phospholipase/acyl hydrolase